MLPLAQVYARAVPCLLKLSPLSASPSCIQLLTQISAQYQVRGQAESDSSRSACSIVRKRGSTQNPGAGQGAREGNSLIGEAGILGINKTEIFKVKTLVTGALQRAYE